MRGARLLCALAGLALLRAPGAPAAAEPLSPSPGDPAQSGGCDTQLAVQSRLEVLEETAAKAAERLQAEVDGLQRLLEGLAWNLPARPPSPARGRGGDQAASEQK